MEDSMKTSQVQLQLLTDEGPEPHLIASRHRRTGEVHFPVFRAISPLAADHETIELSPRGKVYSYTVIHPNPKTGAQPFAIGYVDFPENVRVFGRIATPSDARPRIGDAVRAVRDNEQGYIFETVSDGRLQ
jgi:hypothetical protein